MANNIPFQPMGKTVQVTTNANTATNKVVTADSPVQQYMLANHGSQPVYVWISPGSSPVNVATPNLTTNQYAIVIPQNTIKVVTGPQCSSTANVQVSAISEGGNPEIYVTPGEGF